MQHRHGAVRRWMPAGAAILASAIALTACTAPAAEEAGDAVLTVGVVADADTLLPWTATQFFSVNLLGVVYGTLTEFDEELEVVPGLAESYEVSEDGMSLTLDLRDGVVFHDGSAFDSADVAYSLENIKDEATAAVARASLSAVTAIEAPDADTVVLTLATPDAALPAKLASANMAMLPEDSDLDALASAPNGTGPFVFESRTANQSLSLVRNDDYWGDPVPLAGVDFTVIPDETSVATALQAESVQFATLTDSVVAQTVEAAGIQVLTEPELAYHVLQFNARRGVLADENVRFAISCAIDRQQVLDTAALGEGEVTGPITSPAYRSDPAARPCPEPDLDASADYLAAAGFADGLELTAIVPEGLYATAQAEAENVQAQLAEANITLALEVLESGTYIDRWIAGDFDAAFARNGGRPDPDEMYVRYFTSTGNLNGVAGYSSPQLDELFAEGKATPDPAARAEIYTEISSELEDNAVWVWLFSGYGYTAMVDGVTGFVPMSNGSLQYLRTTDVE